MNNWILKKAQQLSAEGVPFAVATVVRRERPTSGEPGDKAIITANGTFVGWVGGSCAQPTVLKEAQSAIADGEPRLVLITPNLNEQPREGIVLHSMSCYSGGTLEIYIEPYLPEPQLIICGASPVAEALVKIGKTVGFQVVLIDPAATSETFSGADVVLAHIEIEKIPVSRERYGVVATMGHWDEEAIKNLLALKPDYIGVVASRKRFREMARNIREEGVSQEQLDSIKCPAGLDMPVRTLQETALSITSEIVSIRRNRLAQPAAASTPAGVVTAAEEKPTTAEDPVCHMAVDPSKASAPIQFKGAQYYFCSEHCKRNFQKDPRKYISVEAKA